MLNGTRLLVALLQLFAVAVSAASCDEPSWTIKDFKVNFGPEVRSESPLRFAITSSMTNQTTEATCSLRANSRCDILIPASGYHIGFQSWVGLMQFGVNQSQVCDGMAT